MKDKKGQLSEQESLQTISEMIETAKESIHDNGFYFLLWGWLVFIAAVAEFILLKAGIEKHWLVWNIVMPLGGAITFVYYLKNRHKTIARTYVDKFLAYLWGAFWVSLFIVLVFVSSKGGWEVAYPVLIMLYGIGTFVSGGILRFKPLIAGGVICWLLSIAAFFVSFDMQLLILAASLLISYIIPGHILRSRIKLPPTAASRTQP